MFYLLVVIYCLRRAHSGIKYCPSMEILHIRIPFLFISFLFSRGQVTTKKAEVCLIYWHTYCYWSLEHVEVRKISTAVHNPFFYREHFIINTKTYFFLEKEDLPRPIPRHTDVKGKYKWYDSWSRWNAFGVNKNALLSSQYLGRW